MSEELARAVRTIVDDCLAVRRGEEVVIIVDEPLRWLGAELFEFCRIREAEVTLAEIPPRTMHGQEPTRAAAALLAASDVFILPTSRSLTHTQARKAAVRAGARGATLPGITREVLLRTMSADYHSIAERTSQLAARLAGARQARVLSQAGTDLTLELGGRSFQPDTGIVHDRGAFSNLPAGEVYAAPLEGRARGRIVYDGSMAPFGVQARPIVVDVAEGRATTISGDDGALAAALDAVGPLARNVAELGIGTNPMARISGNVLEDEKVLGTVHIALGGNATFGGVVDVPIHLDGILRAPTLVVDGAAIIEDGKPRF